MTADFTGDYLGAAPDPSIGRERSLQAALHLARVLEQLPGVRVLSRSGPKLVVLTPAPAQAVIDALATGGARVRAEGTWEGSIAITVGWWHSRSQLASLAGAIGAFLKSEPIVLIEPDQFERTPSDLPKRRLGTIE